MHVAGRAPTVVFLGGYASNMHGSKALYLDALCRQRGLAFLRLDYQGHGMSSGRFEDGTLGQWADDARQVIDPVCAGPLLLVGSSMGGWIALLIARELAARVVGVVGVAAAPDFGDRMWNDLDAGRRELLQRDGILREPSAYGPEPSVITLKFIEEARRHNLLGAPIGVHCPVRLLHGLDDPDVPWGQALALARRLQSDDVRVTLLKGAGHRLSSAAELELLGRTVLELAGHATGPCSRDAG